MIWWFVLTFFAGWIIGSTIEFLWVRGKADYEKAMLLATCIDTIRRLEGAKDVDVQSEETASDKADGPNP